MVMRRVRWILPFIVALFVVGCSSGGSSAMLVRYERDWASGTHEELTITDDGHLTMRHGDALERLTLTQDQVQRVRDALSAGIPTGDQGDGMIRTVVLANGSSQTPVKPTAGSSVELLELLMTTHSMDGAGVAGSSPPVHEHESPEAH
jgi:hypothetical protein